MSWFKKKEWPVVNPQIAVNAEQYKLNAMNLDLFRDLRGMINLLDERVKNLEARLKIVVAGQ